jgi:pantetheine-phosphate adenylyltransferase
MKGLRQANKTAIYPGSFDPVTKGHLDVIQRALRIFDHLIVAIARNKTKHTLFSERQRLQMLRRALKRFKDRVTVDRFSGLLVDYARRKGIFTIVRGIRTISDFEFEYQMALTNKRFESNLETIFILTSPEYCFISSRLIREALLLGGDVSHFVPQEVMPYLKLV